MGMGIRRLRSVAIGATLLLAGGALFNFAALAKRQPKHHTVARQLTALYKQGQKTFRFDMERQNELHGVIRGVAGSMRHAGFESLIAWAADERVDEGA